MSFDLSLLVDLNAWNDRRTEVLLVARFHIAAIECVYDLKAGFYFCQLAHSKQRSSVTVEVVTIDDYARRGRFRVWRSDLITLATTISHLVGLI